ncbi:YdiU family protein [Vibrio sinensis]|uniref:Protein nucleotidyltransferase YdiU n=1 Tax=Vibrio sinensis TaxID=2302434 RepID=A0A3A6QHB4_9VIBR|nr:YdiU family protein [Vibrio sinensis]RJX70071.1 YdiU family protein [Vibrio sinensis]
MSTHQFFPYSNRFADLPSCFYTELKPDPLTGSRWVAWNSRLAEHFGLPNQATEEFRSLFSGECLPKEMRSLAMKYTGHQFGVYNPDLGDGRGLLLCEIYDENGEAHDVHLKGSGLTPYSRMGDGRAVLRSTVREYLCSEAMVGLGIPTTQALGMLTSDTVVYREKGEAGALLIRVAKSHIRFGHFEYLYYTDQFAELTLLADKVIDWYFPHCRQHEKPYLKMFEQIIERTAVMIAHWQAVGFAHGVMNSDNMSILGETFDYGPFGFLDEYDPNYICNHSDYQGRYAFEQQPRIALWNLSALAHALSPLIERDDLQQALSEYETVLGKKYSQLMRAKLGLTLSVPEDGPLFESMFDLLVANGVDYTNFMRALSNLDDENLDGNHSSERAKEVVTDLFVDREAARAWLDLYLVRCDIEVTADGEPISSSVRCESMRKVNPKFILRNYLAQVAIDRAEEGDYSEIGRLMGLLRAPFDEHAGMEAYAKPPPDWGKKMEISCSS